MRPWKRRAPARKGAALPWWQPKCATWRSAPPAPRKEIKTLIGDSVEQVEIGARLVQDAGLTMDEVVGSVRRVADIMQEITAASSEQSAGIEQVNLAIVQMDQVTQQNAALVEQAAAAAESLQDQATALSELVSVFRLHGRRRPRRWPAMSRRCAARRRLPVTICAGWPETRPRSLPARADAYVSLRTNAVFLQDYNRGVLLEYIMKKMLIAAACCLPPALQAQVMSRSVSASPASMARLMWSITAPPDLRAARYRGAPRIMWAARSTCACRPAMPKTGRSTAARIMPVTRKSISSRTAGIATTTCRVTANSIRVRHDARIPMGVPSTVRTAARTAITTGTAPGSRPARQRARQGQEAAARDERTQELDTTKEYLCKAKS